MRALTGEFGDGSGYLPMVHEQTTETFHFDDRAFQVTFKGILRASKVYHIVDSSHCDYRREYARGLPAPKDAIV